MAKVELPRALEEYFAFAETEPTRRGRRFSITLPYLHGERLERLQWWWHVSPAEEQMYEGKGVEVLRERAVGRFRRHIERWLDMTHQRLHGEDAIPRIGPLLEPQSQQRTGSQPSSAVADSVDPNRWPARRMAS
ncbi:MAG: hypothetical protein RBS02_10975 [Steroidobacteraceae bacterium]|jgi:hypothetical protein|nr:hypothetical protein [Steroidobacteraceae bacterium]